MNADDFAKFVLGQVDAEPFKPGAYYDPEGDFLEFVISPEPYRRRRLDKWVTVYESRASGEIVGSMIKNVRELFAKYPGLRIAITDGRAAVSHLLLAPAFGAENLEIQTTYRKVVKAAGEMHVDLEEAAC